MHRNRQHTLAFILLRQKLHQPRLRKLGKTIRRTRKRALCYTCGYQSHRYKHLLTPLISLEEGNKILSNMIRPLYNGIEYIAKVLGIALVDVQD